MAAGDPGVIDAVVVVTVDAPPPPTNQADETGREVGIDAVPTKGIEGLTLPFPGVNIGQFPAPTYCVTPLYKGF